MTAVWRNFRRDFLDIEQGKDRCLRHIDPKKANPLIRIIYDIVTTHGDHSDDIRAEVSYLFYRNFKRVSNGLCWLKLIAVVAPLMGLLGTVWGMVWVFQAMADVTHANAGVLASGIWSALITTIVRSHSDAHGLLLSDAQVPELSHRGGRAQLPRARSLPPSEEAGKGIAL